MFLDWLLKVLEDEQPDLLAIAGDIYDNGNPSENAQKLFYSFLRNLALRLPHLPTVIIAGNHDSARLEAPRELTELLNVHIRGRVRKHWVAAQDADSSGHWDREYDDLILPFPDAQSPRMVVIAVPYLRTDVINGASYSAGVREVLEELTERAHSRFPDLPVIMMAHLYASGAEIARKSSENIVVGGLEQIDVSGWKSRPDILISGHIHKRQRIASTDWAFYPGSVLPMSFAEKNYHHGVDRLTVNPDGTFEREQIEFHPVHRLRDIPSGNEKGTMTFTALKKLIKMELPERTSDALTPNHDYVRLFISKEKITPDQRHELEALISSRDAVLCTIEEIFETEMVTISGTARIQNLTDIRERDPMDALSEAFTLRHNKQMNERQQDLLKTLLVN